MCKHREWAKSSKRPFLFRDGPSHPWAQDTGAVVSLMVPGSASSLTGNGSGHPDRGEGDSDGRELNFSALLPDKQRGQRRMYIRGAEICHRVCGMHGAGA